MQELKDPAKLLAIIDENDAKGKNMCNDIRGMKDPSHTVFHDHV